MALSREGLEHGYKFEYIPFCDSDGQPVYEGDTIQSGTYGTCESLGAAGDEMLVRNVRTRQVWVIEAADWRSDEWDSVTID